MISIITACYGRLELTQAYLNSLQAHPPDEPWQVVWVDDGSTDGTREWLSKLDRRKHTVFFNEQNLGFARNNNLAARAARGDTLVLLNNDVELTSGWFYPLAESLGKIPNVGVVGNVQLIPASGLIDHAGTFFDLVGRPGHILKGRPRSALKPPGMFCAAATAACWMIKKDTFLGVGGFDESYVNGSEDFDLCLRLGKGGFRHWVDHRSVIWHHVSSSPGRRDRNAYNESLFLRRWAAHTSVLGRRDWPRQYLARVRRNPKQLNAKKTIDAVLRFAGLRKGDSDWAASVRARLMESTEGCALTTTVPGGKERSAPR